MNVSAVSVQAQYQSAQQSTASVRQATLQQVLATSSKKQDGDGDHGVEPQGGGASGSKTGQLLNALA
ncbi:MAG: hypothetical protein M0Z66_04040 [Thermaerobacter sp.]|nr:hypothetical protein [Thermaerobacter sp.]